MRLRVRHTIHTAFGEPIRNVTRILRLTPRSHEGQHVVAWQIDVDTDCILKAGEDGFGNITHTFTAKGPCEAMTITVAGEVDNFDAAGVVRGSAERMPVELFLRETPLTTADDAIRRFAIETTGHCTSTLDRLHTLLGGLHKQVAFDAALPDAVDAGTAFAAGRGNGRDLAHIYAACARHLGVPARVACGYYLCDDKKRGMRHAWCEVFVEGLGWTGFDSAHDLCPQENHVRLATSLDALGAAPVRGVEGGSVAETLDLSAPYGFDWGQSQSQSQGAGWQRQSQGGQSQRQG